MSRRKKLIAERDQLRKRLAEIELILHPKRPISLPDKPKHRLLYVLRCKGGRYYIGQTTNLKLRMAQHQLGKGCWFTRAYPPIRVIRTEVVGLVTQSEAARLEDQLAYEYIERFGYEKVRGGGFIQRDPKWFKDRLNRFAEVTIRKVTNELDQQMMNAIDRAN